MKRDKIVFWITVIGFALPLLLFVDKTYDRFNDGEADRKRLWKYAAWQHEVLNSYADKLGVPRPEPPDGIWTDP
jgi:hypothetical protein